jgi:hypothetical protein
VISLFCLETDGFISESKLVLIGKANNPTLETKVLITSLNASCLLYERMNIYDICNVMVIAWSVCHASTQVAQALFLVDTIEDKLTNTLAEIFYFARVLLRLQKSLIIKASKT